MSKFASFTTARKLLADLERESSVDIIEINRSFYSHFVFHIRDGICVHVDFDDTKKEGYKEADTLENICGNCCCRVNNFKEFVITGGIEKRKIKDAIRIATEGLQRTPSGALTLRNKLAVEYSVLENNSEWYAIQWKYEHQGWTIQGGGLGAAFLPNVLDSAERLSGGVLSEIKENIGEGTVSGVAKGVAKSPLLLVTVPGGVVANAAQATVHGVVGGGMRVLGWFGVGKDKH